MTKARDIADNAGQGGGSKNLVINGSMIISQRSTSVSSQTSSGYKTVDRFRVNASGGTYNQSQQTVTVGGETGLPTQFTKFLRHECTTGNDNHFIMTRIEDVAKFQGDMVLSFYAKGSNPSTLGKLSVVFHQSFGSGGSSDVYTTAQDLTLTGSWQRFTFNVTMASITGKTVGSNNYGSFLIGQDTNASTDAWTLDITGVQLEETSVTDFEHRSFGDELLRCQRYYFQMDGVTDRLGVGGYAVGATEARMDVVFPCSMRAAPTISGTGTAQFDANTDSADWNCSSLTIDAVPTGIISSLGIQIAGTSSMVAGQAGGFRFRSTGTLSFSAEL